MVSTISQLQAFQILWPVEVQKNRANYKGWEKMKISQKKIYFPSPNCVCLFQVKWSKIWPDGAFLDHPLNLFVDQIFDFLLFQIFRAFLAKNGPILPRVEGQ